jgi:hypothetical protein
MPRLPADIWKCWDVIRDDGCYAEPLEYNFSWQRKKKGREQSPLPLIQEFL